MAPQTSFEERPAEPSGAGSASRPGRVGRLGMLDRTEYIRVLQQALRRLGFSAVAQRLERDSGVQMQPEVVNRLQHAVLEGDFDEALAVLPELTNNETTILQARFLILQQKFVEQVKAGATTAAIQTLRHELGPLQVNQQELKRLAGCLLQTRGDAGNPTLQRGPWDVQLDQSREGLMQKLQGKLPPAILVPDGRLEQLLEMAVQAQVEKCICHNCPGLQFSLLSDYKAGAEQLPIQLHQALHAHKDEVWHLQFSHRGDKLASASKDCTAMIWSVSPRGEAFVVHVLGGHPSAVSHLSWSPDDSKLLTCSSQQVKLWNTFTGECVHTIQHHRDSTTACVWFPDGQKFLTSGLDRCIFMCDLQGRVLRRWEMKDRINDLALIAEAGVIVCVTAVRFIQLMRLSDHVPVTSIGDEATIGPSAITSISLTPDGEYLLVNLRSHTGHLWKIGPIARRIAKPLLSSSTSSESPYGLAPEEEGDDDILDEPVMEYHAGEMRVGRYVIRSCIGGLNSGFVASGSEDCRVYVWHRDSGRRLAQLDGHSGTVNGVAWNPVYPHMLASASDDTTIGIWMAPAAVFPVHGKGIARVS